MNKLVFGFLVLIAYGLNASAAAVYQYTGVNFDSVLGPYTTSDRVEMSFSVPSPLAANLNDADISGDVINWQFDDGHQTLTGTNSQPIQFRVSTDGDGQIVAWAMTVWRTPLPTAINDLTFGIETVYDPTQPFIQDLGFRNGRCLDAVAGVCVSVDGNAGNNSGVYFRFGGVLEPQGTWTGGAVQPVPSSSTWAIWLMVGMMVAVAAFARRRAIL